MLVKQSYNTRRIQFFSTMLLLFPSSAMAQSLVLPVVLFWVICINSMSYHQSQCFAVSGKYSNTDSYSASLFGSGYFDEDRQRLLFFSLYGLANNEYEDFQATGQMVESESTIKLAFLQYQYRLEPKLIGFWGFMA